MSKIVVSGSAGFNTDPTERFATSSTTPSPGARNTTSSFIRVAFVSASSTAIASVRVFTKVSSSSRRHARRYVSEGPSVSIRRKKVRRYVYDEPSSVTVSRRYRSGVAIRSGGSTRAGVSVQTVLRHFGNRDGLIDAGVLHAQKSVVEERRTPHGDVTQAVRVIVNHYEQRGRSVLLMLAQEPTDARIARITDEGRAMHRAWVEEVFAPLLPTEKVQHSAGVDLLVVATDVYTWKLLRLDRALGRAQAQQRIERLVRAVLTDLGETGRTHS